MADYNQFKSGGTVLPLPDISLGHSLLQDADPAIFYLLDFLAYCIRTYVEPRLVQEIAVAQALGLAVPLESSLQQKYPTDPTPNFLENQVDVPALFLFRTEGQSEQWTMGHDHDICGVTAAYVLPPIDQAVVERVLPVLRTVFVTIRKKVADGWDPGYAPPGGSLTQSWMDPPFGNVEEAGFGPPRDRRVISVPTGFQYGKLPGTGNNYFPAVILRGFITERDEYAPTVGGPSKFTGADVTGNVKAGDGTVVPATSSTVVRASTQQAPTIASLSATTGSAAGGTPVTVTGTGFLSAGFFPLVAFFGPPSAPTFAASVAYVSATQVSFSTPAVQGAGGAVDLTIINPDGQRATLPAAFTFT